MSLRRAIGPTKKERSETPTFHSMVGPSGTGGGSRFGLGISRAPPQLGHFALNPACSSFAGKDQPYRQTTSIDMSTSDALHWGQTPEI
jgi:hypothetical protein